MTKVLGIFSSLHLSRSKGNEIVDCISRMVLIDTTLYICCQGNPESALHFDFLLWTWDRKLRVRRALMQVSVHDLILSSLGTSVAFSFMRSKGFHRSPTEGVTCLTFSSLSPSMVCSQCLSDLQRFYHGNFLLAELLVLLNIIVFLFLFCWMWPSLTVQPLKVAKRAHLVKLTHNQIAYSYTFLHFCNVLCYKSQLIGMTFFGKISS